MKYLDMNASLPERLVYLEEVIQEQMVEGAADSDTRAAAINIRDTIAEARAVLEELMWLESYEEVVH